MPTNGENSTLEENLGLEKSHIPQIARKKKFDLVDKSKVLPQAIEASTSALVANPNIPNIEPTFADPAQNESAPLASIFRTSERKRKVLELYTIPELTGSNRVSSPNNDDNTVILKKSKLERSTFVKSLGSIIIASTNLSKPQPTMVNQDHHSALPPIFNIEDSNYDFNLKLSVLDLIGSSTQKFVALSFSIPNPPSPTSALSSSTDQAINITAQVEKSILETISRGICLPRF